MKNIILTFALLTIAGCGSQVPKSCKDCSEVLIVCHEASAGFFGEVKAICRDVNSKKYYKLTILPDSYVPPSEEYEIDLDESLEPQIGTHLD